MNLPLLCASLSLEHFFFIRAQLASSSFPSGIRHQVLEMNYSADDTFDPTHSSDSDSDGNPDVSSAYVDRFSASSLDATLLVDT